MQFLAIIGCAFVSGAMLAVAVIAIYSIRDQWRNK
jgi:hypothetical protein